MISDANIPIKNSPIPFSNLRVVFDLKGSFKWFENYGIFLPFVTLPYSITVVVSDRKWVEIIWVTKG